MSITGASPSPSSAAGSYDRQKELKSFDESKLGVKGLVDSGITALPPFFIHPPETLSDLPRYDNETIPTIDLGGVESGGRAAAVEQIARAARDLGFFQVVNHGIPAEVMDHTIGGVKAVHEMDQEEKERLYRREMGSGVALFSNIDLFHSKAASWRDTLQIRLGPTSPNLEELPEMCRNAVVDWDREATRVAELLMELLCEGLGLEPTKLKEMTCLEGRTMVGHYYPYCPQPDLTVGIASHTDPGVVTVLLQDHIGGLQVKHGEGWVDVKPVPGAIVINIGDILKIMSNEAYKSADHRVIANPSHEPRVSIAIFFNPSTRNNLLGPFPDLISPARPALYRQFTFEDYMRRFFTRELDNKSLTDYYRLL